ncbi:uncharacterized protein LOC122306411 isoform X2 [Carya illinoinensis]|uniref:uncharacterized protein LOC122306411 isoform X2 n=1 Tax=Carya illinoinensis TaxID=32201 RepID=UPI001C71D0F1|nr:uncharacterized protein LOC122306411 isoform X2 [Carya illinoinensis]
MVTINSSIAAWISHFLDCMGGCFGCCTGPTPIIAVDEPSKGLKIQGRMVRKSSLSDDFWSTSTYDLDNSTVQSLKSISSISTSNQNLNCGGGIGGTSSNSDFVNHGKFSYIISFFPAYVLRQIWLFPYGAIWSILITPFGLLLWNQTRLQWIGSSRFRDQSHQSREPRLSWNATYESLLGTKQPLPQPIPLSEMIEFLVDVWEQEGLYD